MGGIRRVIAGVLVTTFIVLIPIQVEAISYIALGDSFTSGEGESTDDHYLFQDDGLSRSCHLSDRSYPYIAAVQLGIADVHSVACSGGQIKDIYGDEQYMGQQNRLLDDGKPLGAQALEDIAADTLSRFAPGKILQSRFIQQYHPGIISVGIGGNDIGMIDKLKSCMMLDTCSWATGDGRTQAGREIKSLFSRLVALYSYLKTLSPSSKLYAIGYPKIINPSGVCDQMVGAMFSNDEKQFMDQSINYLDAVIAQAAYATGSVFVPEADAFSKNALCDLTSTPTMNTIRFGDDIAPITAVDWLKLFGAESFHPTPFGHELLSHNVAFSMTTLGGIAFALPGLTAPIEPDYWNDDGRLLPKTQVASMTNEQITSDSFALTLPPGSFKANTTVQVLIRSRERQLGSGTSSAEGSITAALTLPSDIEPGFHTIIVRGLDDSDKMTDYYQTIEYSGTNKHGGDRPAHVIAATSSVNQGPPGAAKNVTYSRSQSESVVLGASTAKGYQSVHGSTHATKSHMQPWRIIANAVILVAVTGSLVILILVIWRGG
jgi:hypothetical protein